MYTTFNSDIPKVNKRGTLFMLASAHQKMNSQRIYRSTDGGVNWKRLALQDVSTFVVTGNSNVLAFSYETNYGVGGFYLSSDEGDTWREIAKNDFALVFKLAVCSDGAILAICTPTPDYGNGLGENSCGVMYRSDDGGFTWTYKGIELECPSAGFQLSAGSRGYAFLIPSDTSSFYLSTDNGESWQQKTVR